MKFPAVSLLNGLSDVEMRIRMLLPGGPRAAVRFPCGDEDMNRPRHRDCRRSKPAGTPPPVGIGTGDQLKPWKQKAPPASSKGHDPVNVDPQWGGVAVLSNVRPQPRTASTDSLEFDGNKGRLHLRYADEATLAAAKTSPRSLAVAPRRPPC